MHFVITETKSNIQPNANNTKRNKNAVYCATSFGMKCKYNCSSNNNNNNKNKKI